MNLFTVCFVTIVFVAVVQYLAIPPIDQIALTTWGDDKLRSFVSSPLNARVFSTFMNANWFGWAAGAFLIFYFQFWLLADTRERKWIGGLCISAFIALVMSGSRSALLALIPAMGAAIILHWHQFRARKLTISLLLFVLTSFVVFYYAVADVLFSRYLELFEAVANQSGGVATASTRLELWQVGLSMIAADPVLGAGSSVGFLAHNSYITLAIYFGIPGAVLVCVVLGGAAWLSILHAPRKRCAVPLIVLTLVMFLTGEFLFSTQVMLTLFLMCWMVTHYAGNSRPETFFVSQPVGPRSNANLC
jgi:O-antigen ligase